ncbi:putative metallopeptidase [Bremerella cremea]|uniref:putative metallopeptidase n=1 Tax=Bremerella cremea TaxID=1031537 RepID=UPI0031E7B114
MGRIQLHRSVGRRGFDFTFAMRRLVVDMTKRMPELKHIDMSRVAVAIVQARIESTHGVFATLTPMRFEKGARYTTRRGHKYACQMLFDEHGREMLYILSFYLPRFQNMSFSEKMITIFHELWHISPDFDGDIRRHPGRCYAHSSSQKEYDEHMAVLSNQYLIKQPPPELYTFLEHDFTKLYQNSGGIYGVKIPRPKLIPVAA